MFFSKGLSLIGGAVLLLGSANIGAVVATEDFQYDLSYQDNESQKALNKYGQCMIPSGVCPDTALKTAATDTNFTFENGAEEYHR